MPGTLSRFPAKLFGGKSAPRTVFAPNCLLGAALLVREQLVHDERQPLQLSAAYGLDLDDPAVGERERDSRDDAVTYGDDLRELTEVYRARVVRRRAAPERRLAEQDALVGRGDDH